MASIQVAVLTPPPGTRLRERLQREGRILETGWENYTGWDVTFVPKKMTKEELERGVVRVYQKVMEEDVVLKRLEYFKSIHSNLPGRGG